MRFKWLKKFHYWWLGGRSIARSIFRVAAAKQAVAILGGALIVAYVLAAFYTEAGEFVIRVDHPGEKQLVLSDTTDFSEELIVLNGTAIDEADNISIYDIDTQVAKVDGEHNGRNYIAYTYYVKNISPDPVTYDYTLSIRRATKGIEEATWVLLYHNGKQQVFAKEGRDKKAEKQISEYQFPFEEDALKAEQYAYDEQMERFVLTTTPFATSKIVATAERAMLQPEEVDKYTVVIWLEGEDPQCVNDILGGTIEMMMKIRY